MKIDRLYYLLDGYKKSSLSADEQQELRKALADSSNADALKSWIEDSWDREVLTDSLPQEQSEQIFKAIREMITPGKKLIFRFRYRYRLGRIAAAASIIIAISAVSYLWVSNKKQSLNDELIKTIAQSQDIKAPDATKARITLADGSTLYLDSLEKGESAREQGAEIVKMEKGELQYKGTGTAKEVTFNTLINPRGSDVVTITLADG
ncbi:MAG: hypothetical protein PHP30_10300, partial [Bacteroidales bacterium]|nr:hypothetical protein [Bacteroidales bacterium]